MPLDQSIPCTEVSGEVVDTLTRAFGWAIRRRQPAVGTEHLLFALLEGDSAAGGLLAPTVRRSGAMMGLIRAKSLGHWVSNDDTGTEASKDLAVAALLREAEWTARRSGKRDASAASEDPHPQPTRALLSAIRQALLHADELGVPRANTTHVLMGLLHDPQNRASEALRERRVPQDHLITRLQEHPSARERAEPHAGTARALQNMGTLNERGQLVASLLAKVARKGSGFGTPVLAALRWEAKRQAVRLAHPKAATAHLLLAVLALDEQLAATGGRFSTELAASNTAAELLRTRGATLHAAAVRALDLVPASARWQCSRSIPEDPNVEHALTKARWRAQEREAPIAGTNHLLAVLLAESDPLVTELLAGLDIDTDELRRALA